MPDLLQASTNLLISHDRVRRKAATVDLRSRSRNMCRIFICRSAYARAVFRINNTMRKISEVATSNAQTKQSAIRLGLIALMPSLIMPLIPLIMPPPAAAPTAIMTSMATSGITSRTNKTTNVFLSRRLSIVMRQPPTHPDLANDESFSVGQFNMPAGSSVRARRRAVPYLDVPISRRALATAPIVPEPSIQDYRQPLHGTGHKRTSMLAPTVAIVLKDGPTFLASGAATQRPET